jgi:hypothetical protein
MRQGLAVTAALAAALAVGPGTAQTRITAPDNRYQVSEDVELGREAAGEVARELPLLDDRRVDDWVAEVGRTLVAAIPDEFQHPEFTYTFAVIDQAEINAFALPGGPMFLNRGMIEAATAEAQVAGVMAHEISHVALRHGTAQATKAQSGWFQLGAIGAGLARIFGGTIGGVASEVTQFGLGATFLKFGREYESQADILGAQMLARAGYDPREMANMFKTIEEQGGGGQIEFLSSHPNPANRYEAINQEAQSLRVQGNASTGVFPAVRERLASLPPAYTAEQIANGQARSGRPSAGGASTTAARTVPRVDPPASRYRPSSPLAFLRLSVPENWSEVSGDATGVTYAPDGGYATDGGALTGLTHGFQAGAADLDGDLEGATEALVASFARSNPDLRREGRYVQERIDGREGLRATLSNVSEVTGQRERITLATTRLGDGRLLYLIGVVPETDASSYEDVFRRIRQSVAISGR